MKEGKKSQMHHQNLLQRLQCPLLKSLVAAVADVGLKVSVCMFGNDVTNVVHYACLLPACFQVCQKSVNTQTNQ